ncbi:hypothetical protein FBQ87_05525 [Sphingobacteriales bacterium CHB3]|nr:hypothetical protein [Sphingobacteriales bacterium CHB3]
MDGPELLIPLAFFLTIGGIWGSIVLTRHKERMSMIERGLKAEEIKSLYERNAFRIDPLSSLKWGMVLIGVGLAIMLGILLTESLWFNDGVFPGLIATFGGIGLILFYFVASKKHRQ